MEEFCWNPFDFEAFLTLFVLLFALELVLCVLYDFDSGNARCCMMIVALLLLSRNLELSSCKGHKHLSTEK